MRLQDIERAWRVGWMRAIGRALPGTRRATLPHTGDRPLKVLFVRYERIGDMIMSTGMLRVLASAHPAGTAGVTLDLLANPTTKPVLDNNPYVRKLFTLDRKSWKSYRDVGRALRAERYDVIVDGRINNPPVFTSTPLLMLMARAPYRVGVTGGNNDRIYNVAVDAYDRSVHYIEGSKALARPFGVDVDAVDWQPEIFLTADERARAGLVWREAAALVSDGESSREKLLVNLSASEPKRRWADANFIDVLRAVRARHPEMPIVVMGLPSEWNSVRTVATAVRAHAAPTPSLRDALALVGTSDRVFTPDTSISHAASAFRRPAVVLLKRDHHPYAPWNTPGDIVFWDGETIHGLPVEAVREPVLRLVERSSFGEVART
jgi:ADP-heptose:LPS heptosyltransferase